MSLAKPEKKMDNGFVMRTYNFEIRAEEEDEKGVVYGVPIVFERETHLGYFKEIIHRGALDGADCLKDVRFLVNHNRSMIPLARSRNNNSNSTMQLTIEDDGLHIKVKLDIENNADARALWSAIKRGDITGMSFMFKIDDERWENLKSDCPTRHINRISTVVEVSAVTFPAYEQTQLSARCKEELDSYRSALDSARNESAPDGVAALKLEYLKRSYLGNNY